MKDNKLLYQLDHSKGKGEVLRAALVQKISSTNTDIICTCGADGNAIIWCIDNINMQVRKINTYLHLSVENTTDGAQIYACESIDIIQGIFITASDNLLRVWNTNNTNIGGQNLNNCDSNIPIHLWQLNSSSSEESYGGKNRNPLDICYIFDIKLFSATPSSKYSRNNRLLVACSDGMRVCI